MCYTGHFMIVELFCGSTENAAASQGEERCRVLHVCGWTDAAVLVRAPFTVLASIGKKQ